MIERTLGEIARMAGGTLADAAMADRPVKGVSKDTRTLAEGNLYVPIIGEAFDGHNFAEAALEQGASGLLWQRDHGSGPTGAPLIYVEDALQALQQLATSYRRELAVRVVGITGSNGKTTTKDMTAAVLSTTFRVHKTLGNYNNHIGLPLTLLQMNEDTEIAVLEMGMSGRGEIELLSRLAEPEIAIITNIGEAHLLQLGSRLEIARAKAEILAGLQPGGVLVYHGDEPLLREVLPEWEPQDFRGVTFGREASNDLFPLDLRLTESGTQMTVNTDPQTPYYIPMLGAHNAVNALAAIAVGRHFGLTAPVMAEGLQGLVMTGMRIEVSVAPSGLTVWNDAYNASPTAMRAALALLHEAQGFERKYAVLGDMLELGEKEAEFHREIGRVLDPAHVEAVFLFGPLAGHIAEGALEKFPPERVRHYEDKETLARELAEAASAQDVVLIKGSRGMRMEQVASFLVQLGG
ncbi:UDP-N-acetylmuramoylalanyl-D-glutamyl-2, 6-diaminopimelate--D-alanyl-D-alanyl ligase [Paenibacillus mucilaginosus 3016]|uniref:UDP-N-acetylmuramoyl-tripeptide--D-alanyl-D-alanine ligase n=2 Tax=Paenibacillus mucilaginosus TaxID=61624 RepID=H6NG80_9BACL|nr:UDP-N-acetylmuramoyl-tripeptide--D-alanyl-D-alanine ligase [Paenibacillus mucilaginosus]AFC32207.1 UDP-N-acetylmuramoylalanyl-D-glutamyl-2, 6-diaminopimelate--D-alanyl-D-alanyl ligase [Paenibacillus mucilaginosus 3016]AFH64509.1 UDP-N-acetylmuramoyl-tripeptide--D-alanyl-D-alanine ligase [Paenibacillus mucilaginosus K02]WFA20707.1 UDP-N-acetylmuramoyl-tripeptide--D-alanyl-D-alanine ligase [Paenibacillus mucilaginosus]